MPALSLGSVGRFLLTWRNPRRKNDTSQESRNEKKEEAEEHKENDEKGRIKPTCFPLTPFHRKEHISNVKKDYII